MATITGTDNNDVINTGSEADVVYGGAGNDRIATGAGDDIVYGGLGNDILNGDAGNDRLYGEEGDDGFFGGGGNDFIDGGVGNDIIFGDGGNDVLLGGDGNDRLSGGTFNDRLDGGRGNDILNGDDGDDVLVYRAGEGNDVLNGGNGHDTLELHLASSDVSATLRAEMAAYAAWSPASGTSFTFSSLGLTISNIESANIYVDGAATPLSAFLNQAPVAAAAVDAASLEDQELQGVISANDPDGDALTFAVEQGPSNGTLQLDAITGAYSYLASANYSGADSFTVRIADPSGAFTMQTVNVAVGAVADAPVLTASDSASDTGITLNGTSAGEALSGGVGSDVITGQAGNDVIVGDNGPQTAVVALNIAAALTDLDGSETLSITVAGLPGDAVLSAGTRQSNGNWVLALADLAGLTAQVSNAADLALTVTATSLEANGSAASTTAALNIVFNHGTGGDHLDGGTGNDMITGSAHDDVIIGGAGSDILNGGAGNDRFVMEDGNGSGLAGLLGDLLNPPGRDTINGGDGFDTVDYSGRASAVSINLSLAQTTSTERISNVEGVIGSAYDDTITGNSADNLLDGGNGSDRITGGAGNDTIHGGAGNDVLDGGSGNDVIYDGEGNDTVNGGSGDDYFYAGNGSDTYVGGSGFDTLDYSLATVAIDVDASKKVILGSTNDKIDGIEKIIGSQFADTFKGGSGGNYFDGGAGDDIMRGMGGADFYSGGAGNDTFVWLAKDVMKGKTHLGLDTVLDFGDGDKLDISDFTKGNKKNAPLDSLVRVTETADGSLVSVLSDKSFVDVVLLDDVFGKTAASLFANDHFIL